MGGCSLKTDSQGRFELRAYSGYAYRVITLADKSGKRTEDVYGESLPFNLDADVEGMKIVLSLPGRPWDKRNPKATEKQE